MTYIFFHTLYQPSVNIRDLALGQILVYRVDTGCDVEKKKAPTYYYIFS